MEYEDIYQDLSYLKIKYEQEKEINKNSYESLSDFPEQQEEVDKLAQAEIEEALINFRRPIDYKFWGKRTRWTLMETTLLISNICPKDITYKKWKDIENYLNQSEIEKYQAAEKNLILIDDHSYDNNLSYSKQIIDYGNQFGPDIYKIVFTPSNVVEWAEIYEIEIPEELKNVVKSKFNKKITISKNWQESYKQLQDEAKVLKQQLEKDPKTELTLEELAETEEILNIQTQRSCANVIANIAVALIKNKNGFNSTHIENILKEEIPLEKIEELKKHGFKILSRKTLTRYLKKPRLLMGLKETAKITKDKK